LARALRMKKDEEFSEWYNAVIDRAELSDKRYPIKGMNVWRPYGWAIMKLIDNAIREEFDSTGHGEVNFPVLIPETEFKKESDHVKGFEGDVFWVTRGGFNELDVKLLLRPTSETAMYPMFKLWIRSHADLPLKVYQIVPVFRYETKMTRAFMRVREIHFFEAHTAHATYSDAEQQIQEDLQMNERVMRLLALPYIVSRRPDWDKFPGSHYSLGSDTLLPSGRAAQLATFHQYKDNFAKVYDVTYEAEGGEHRFVHQTTDGMSERLLGAMIAVHGDEKGLVLPPAAAPVQAVVVPILEKGRQEEMLLEAQRLFLELRDRIRMKLDDRDLRPGEKYYEWEARGVPVRIELGPRDIAKQAVTIVRRDTGERRELPREGLPERLRSVLELIQIAMWDRAEKLLKDNTFTITDLTKARDGFNRMGWCGKESCGKAITERTAMSVLGTPFYPEPFEGKCIVDGEPTKQVVYAAKAY
jgi:prolyl-tRNA synthetase